MALSDDSKEAFHFLRAGGTVSLEAWHALPDETKQALKLASELVEQDRAERLAREFASEIEKALAKPQQDKPAASLDEALERAARSAVSEAKRIGA